MAACKPIYWTLKQQRFVLYMCNHPYSGQIMKSFQNMAPRNCCCHVGQILCDLLLAFGTRYKRKIYRHCNKCLWPSFRVIGSFGTPMIPLWMNKVKFAAKTYRHYKLVRKPTKKLLAPSSSAPQRRRPDTECFKFLTAGSSIDCTFFQSVPYLT